MPVTNDDNQEIVAMIKESEDRLLNAMDARFDRLSILLDDIRSELDICLFARQPENSNKPITD